MDKSLQRNLAPKDLLMLFKVISRTTTFGTILIWETKLASSLTIKDYPSGDDNIEH